MKITITKKPKKSRYIPYDDPFTKKKGQKENMLHIAMREMARKMTSNLYKENAFLTKLREAKRKKDDRHR